MIKIGDNVIYSKQAKSGAPTIPIKCKVTGIGFRKDKQITVYRLISDRGVKYVAMGNVVRLDESQDPQK